MVFDLSKLLRFKTQLNFPPLPALSKPKAMAIVGPKINIYSQEYWNISHALKWQGSPCLGDVLDYSEPVFLNIGPQPKWLLFLGQRS